MTHRNTILVELEELGSTLANQTLQNTYHVPEGYFERLATEVMARIKTLDVAGHQSPSEELESISPFLSSLPKKNPYSIPAGYFDQLNYSPAVPKPVTGKVIGISRKWFRYAAAAIITGIVAGSALFFLVKSQPDPNKNPQAWIKKNVEKKVDEQKLDEFLALATGGDNNEPVSNPNTVSNEVKELMKDVPESEIQSFLTEMAGTNGSDETDVLLN